MNKASLIARVNDQPIRDTFRAFDNDVAAIALRLGLTEKQIQELTVRADTLDGRVTTLEARPIAATETCRVYHDVAQSIPNNALTTLAFNQEYWDDGNLHNNAINNSRILLNPAGIWLIGFSLEFATNATGIRLGALQVTDGAFTYRIGEQLQQAVTDAFSHRMVGSSLFISTNTTTYVELRAFQNSGGALNVNSVSSRSPDLWVHRLSS